MTDVFHRRCLRRILGNLMAKSHHERRSNDTLWTNGIAWHSSNEKKTFHRTHPV